MAKGDICKCGKVIKTSRTVCAACATSDWRKANPEKSAVKNRRNLADWRKANPEKHRAEVAKWRATNPEKTNIAKRAKAAGVTVAQYRRMLADPNYQPGIDDKDEPDDES